MKITAFKNHNILILSLASGLLFFGFNAAEQHFTAFYQIIGKQNLAYESLAILYSAIIVGNFIGPMVVRKIGTKMSTILGFITYILLVFGITTKSSIAVYGLSFLLGLGAGFAGIARVEILRLIAPKTKRGEYSGAIESVRTAGGFFGILIAGIFLWWFDINKVLIILGLVMTAGTLTLLKLKNIDDDTQVGLTQRQNLTLMLKLMKNRMLLLLVPYSVSGGFLLGLILGIVPATIEKNYGIALVGPITAIFHITLALTLLIAGYFSDIKGKFKFIYASIIATIIATIVFINFTGLPSLIFIMILLGLGGSLGGGAFSALMLDIFESKTKEASAVLGNLSLILGVVPSFLLPKWFSQSQLLYIALFLSAISLISIWAISKSKHQPVL